MDHNNTLIVDKYFKQTYTKFKCFKVKFNMNNDNCLDVIQFLPRYNQFLFGGFELALMISQ